MSTTMNGAKGKGVTIASVGALICVLAVSVDARGVELPAQVTESAEGVTYDLMKLVVLTEQRGWTIDRFEVDKLLPEALLSVCQVSPQARLLARRNLSRQLQAAGGSHRRLWDRSPRRNAAFNRALTLERSLSLLDKALRTAKQDCPVYLPPTQRFAGRHRDGRSWFIGGEGGGAFAIRHTNRWIFGGGGRGRLTLGRGLGDGWSVRGGIELGGAALVNGSLSTDDVQLDLVSAVPLIVRKQSGIYIFDVELAGMTYGIPGRDVVRYGGRAGALFGLSATRIRAVLPWTGLLVTAEYVAGRAHLPGQWTVRAGFVVGFNLAL